MTKHAVKILFESAIQARNQLRNVRLPRDAALARRHRAMIERRYAVWAIVDRRGDPDGYECRVTWAG
ncbi:hypothetical protein ON010_g2630 [Phytophthora cinnamomi]|nr:hypothetical protein ON010_g2630 [Phytophthora cinnamomi]